MKIKCWVEIKENIIINIFRSNVDQSHIMTEIPINNDVKLNTNIKLYDENYKKIPDELLVEKGILTDKRGFYWDKNNYKNILIIDQYDVLPPEGFTDIRPIVNMPCIWDGDNWIVDEVEKERLSKLLTLNEVQEFVSGLVSEITEVNK
jgi:hypothetical protein